MKAADAVAVISPALIPESVESVDLFVQPMRFVPNLVFESFGSLLTVLSVPCAPLERCCPLLGVFSACYA